jgi:uncharacterized membrane-anchored protein YitT (DUF2179 family)
MPRHTAFEDLQALLGGTLLLSLGVTLMGKAGLVTGGVTGLCLLLHYLTGLPFAGIFFALSVPFYVLAVRRLGWTFTLKTFGAVLLFSLSASWLPQLLALERVDALYAAVMGGTLIGVGLLMLFRHQASLGGFSIVALWLQERFGLRAGLVQLVLDFLILALSYRVVAPAAWAASLLGTAILNLTLAVNHRPGRYLAH